MLSNLGDISIKEAMSFGKLDGAIYWTKFGAGKLNTTQSTVFTGIDVGDLYKYLDYPKKVSIASTDTEDIVGGSGGNKARVYGLDEDFNLIDEVLELNGQTPVESTLVYSRVYRLSNESLSGHDFLGQVYIGPNDDTWTAGEPTKILLHIDAERNQTQFAGYTVPRGYKLLISNIYLDSHRDKELEMWIVTRKLNSNVEAENPVFNTKSNWGMYRNKAEMDISENPLILEPLEEFEIRGNVSTTGSERVFASLFGYLIPLKHFSSRGRLI